MRQFGRLILVGFAIFLSAVAAQAEEVIGSFNVDIVAEIDGDFLITETLAVNVEGRNISRGIFRDLPAFLMIDGAKVPVRYDVKSVTRNGKRENYAVEKDGNAYRLRIGDADYYLPYQIHTYEITYEVKDQIRRFETFDEIYWNVTGNYWRFPINAAKATIHVPSGAKLTGRDIYTGGQGQSGSDAVFQETDGAYVISSTRRFEAGEGLTVSLQFEKGVFAPAPESTQRYIWWLKNGALILMSLSFLGITGFYYRNWNKVGRDPVKGAVFARYDPPEDYSAAAASYIFYRGVKSHKALIATLTGLAAKKWISIDTSKKKTVIKPLDGESTGKERLTKEETYLMGRLFPKNRQSAITLEKKVNIRFNGVYSAFKRRLSKNFGADYYRLNIGYIIVGIILSFVGAMLTLSQFSHLSSSWVWAVFLALIIMNIVFMFLMPAPTQKGQETRTEIEGFRLFMKTAEKLKFDSVEVGSDQPPPMSVKRYEQLLPYAIALGVEKPWSQYFEKVMPVEAKDYQPVWGGSHGNYRNITNLTDSMVSNISSGVSSAQPQSSSSSGSGGGGFSGGGGGGGGGGGW